MGQGNVGEGLDFCHLQYSQIGLPLAEPIERIVVRAEVFRQLATASSGAVEHPTECDTIDRSRMDAEPNDAAGVLIHDDQDPVGPQRDSHRNRSILQRLSFMWPRKVSQEGPPEPCPGRWWWARILRTTSLSMGMWNATAICCAIRGQPQLGLRCFISTTARMSSALGPFGPGFRRQSGENSMRYFRLLMAL